MKLSERLFNKLLTILFPSNFFFFSHKGFCPCCDQNVVYRSTNDWLRDHFFCQNCGSIPRERALMLTIEKYCPNWKTLLIHESSPENRGASLKLKRYSEKYISSQFYPNFPLGSMVKGHRNEDLEKQTFPDNFFDLVITQDVMEHVFDSEKAFIEIARTLKKGGMHIFTVPIVNKHKPTEIWANKGINGEPVFLREPEYHGNPVDPKGSPVTMHWGYDIIDFIKDKSELETLIEYIDNLDYGIRAEYIEVLVSIKIK